MTHSPMELANTFIQTGELADALNALDRQLNDHPDDDTARRLRISVLMRLDTNDHLDHALDDIQRLSDWTAADHLTRSIIYEQQGDLAAASDAMQQARALSPDDERHTERQIELLLKHDNTAQALTLIRQQPQTWRWLEREADVLVQQGDDTTATARYGLVLSHLQEREGEMREDYLNALKARVLLARAHAYRRLGQLPSAADHYRQAQDLIPNDPTIPFNMGLLRMKRGEMDIAVKQCQEALAIAPPALRAEMRASIQDDPAYSELAALLSNEE